jgi:hypothetical protein
MKTILKIATVMAVAGAFAFATSASSDAKTYKRAHRAYPAGAVAAGVAAGAVTAGALAANGYYYGPGYGSYAYEPGPYAYAPEPYGYDAGPYAYAAGSDALADVNGYMTYAYSPGFYGAAGMSCITEGQPGKVVDYANCY